MARYIDVDVLMKELEREVELADDWKTAHEIANIVKYAPIEDVVPVIHAKWVPYEFGNEKWRKCTNCGKATQYKIDILRKDGTISRLTEKQGYCPNCGAKMDEKE